MIKLYQLEECPYCAKVRRVLAAQGLSFRAINVPKLGSQRSEVLALSGVTSPEVPVLVNGEDVVQDSSVIIEYLREYYRYKRNIPTVYEACKSNGIEVEELLNLFPDGYRRGACRAAGLPFFP